MVGHTVRVLGRSNGTLHKTGMAVLNITCGGSVSSIHRSPILGVIRLLRRRNTSCAIISPCMTSFGSYNTGIRAIRLSGRLLGSSSLILIAASRSSFSCGVVTRRDGIVFSAHGTVGSIRGPGGCIGLWFLRMGKSSCRFC